VARSVQYVAMPPTAAAEAARAMRKTLDDKKRLLGEMGRSLRVSPRLRCASGDGVCRRRVGVGRSAADKLVPYRVE